MQFIIVIVASVCLLQGLTDGHTVVLRDTSNPILVVANNAIQSIGALVQNVGRAIVNANTLIHKYSDNSTDYAAEFRLASTSQIQDLSNMTDKAMVDAGSNGNFLACITSKRNETQHLAISVIEDVGRCATTKARQFADLAVNIAILANTTYNIIPTTKAKVKNCDREPNDIFKIGCITWASAEASAIVAEVGVGVTTTFATATGLFATFRSDLELCAQARILAFRKRVAGIPLAIGACTAKTLLG